MPLIFIIMCHAHHSTWSKRLTTNSWAIYGLKLVNKSVVLCISQALYFFGYFLIFLIFIRSERSHSFWKPVSFWWFPVQFMARILDYHDNFYSCSLQLVEKLFFFDSNCFFFFVDGKCKKTKSYLATLIAWASANFFSCLCDGTLFNASIRNAQCSCNVLLHSWTSLYCTTLRWTLNARMKSKHMNKCVLDVCSGLFGMVYFLNVRFFNEFKIIV